MNNTAIIAVCSAFVLHVAINFFIRQRKTIKSLQEENKELKAKNERVEKAEEFVCDNLLEISELFHKGYDFADYECPELIVRKEEQEQYTIITLAEMKIKGQAEAHLIGQFSVWHQDDGIPLLKRFEANSVDHSRLLLNELIGRRNDFEGLQIEQGFSNPLFEEFIKQAGANCFVRQQTGNGFAEIWLKNILEEIELPASV